MGMLAEYLLLALYTLAVFLLLVLARRGFFRLRWRHLLLVSGLVLVLMLLGALTASGLLVVSFSGPPLLPPPGVPVEPASPIVSLLALPVVAAGAWLGPGPALLIGLGGGIVRAHVTTAGITDPFQFALYGFLVGFFLRQNYRGRVPQIARQPIFAGPLSTLLSLPVWWLSVFTHVAGSGLAGLDYSVTLVWAHLPSLLLESLGAAVLVQAAYLLIPRVRPVVVTVRYPPYTRTLSRRFLFLFVPLILLVTFLLVYAVTGLTLRVAASEARGEMERTASSAAEQVAYFIHLGQGLIDGFASDDALWQGGRAEVESRLEGDLYTLAFFKQLMLFDAAGQQVAMHPATPSGDPELTAEEEAALERVLDHGAPQRSIVHRSKQGEVIVSFLAPVEDEATGGRLGALLGRARLDGDLQGESAGHAIHPVMGPILESLQGVGTSGEPRAEGFVVEQVGERLQIVAHQDPDMLLAAWSLEGGVSGGASGEGGHARFFERLGEDNARQLVYFLPVEGYDDWAVVVLVPYEVVLDLATKIGAPLLLLQIVAGGLVITVILVMTGRLTRPLKQLAAAADHIAEGDLTRVVRIEGDDEVTRVGHAFEGMRLRLKDRLDDLSLLLRISQAVSATLDLMEGMPIILEAVLKTTQACVARIVLFSAEGYPEMVMGRGEPHEGLGALDRALAAAASGLAEPLVVENLARAKTLATYEAADSPIKSVIALPVRSKGRVTAVIWIGYEQVRRFDASEIDLLSTLAGQTAALVENARLFQAAEGGRRRLAAILSSTTDAFLVTDRNDRILLVNPAAEQAFGVAADAAVGQKVGDAGLAPALAQAFEGPISRSEVLSKEIPLADGRTLYASVSPILSTDGEFIGRVAVMRDITRFKELDELKSEFVATVSHDLRAPLTFMRGYTTMLPMVGETSDKQREYVEKILQGVGQMSELIDNLLDLGRIEAGIGLERKPCHLGAILVEAVDGVRARATAKGLTLRLDPVQGSVVVAGDAALLRQAVTNLVDNAIKYTPSGGIVTVGLTLRDQQVVIRVADTGIGIAPDDQVRLFEKFYRIKRRDTAEVPGTGLGLAIVKSVIDRHGGRVWVDSELDRGSTFYISLPLGNAQSAAAGG